MASLAYFPLYPKDFLGATGRLNAEKFGIYTRLLFASWIEPLADDTKELANLVGCSRKKTTEILTRFFVLKNGFWINERLERERLKALDKHRVAVAKAKTAADARWNAPSNATSNAQAMPTQNSEHITHNSEIKTQKERKRFAPPSLDEVIKLFIEKGSNKIEAEKFFYFYESKNWMVGKNKMKSWKASVGGWIARNKSKEVESVVISTLE